MRHDIMCLIIRCHPCPYFSGQHSEYKTISDLPQFYFCRSFKNELDGGVTVHVSNAALNVKWGMGYYLIAAGIEELMNEQIIKDWSK